MHKSKTLSSFDKKKKIKTKNEVPDTDFFNQQHTFFLFDKLKDLIKILFLFFCLLRSVRKNIKFYNGLINLFFLNIALK